MKNIKIYFVSIIVILGSVLYAQDNHNNKDVVRSKKNKKKYPLYWNMLDRNDTLFAANINKAYEYISAHNLKPKQKVIVADINGGGNIDHEDLKNILWTNPKEVKGNGVDDDNNGYVDDINGWNFLGNKEGVSMVKSSTEGDREFVRLIDKYKSVGLDSTKVLPKDESEYKYFRYTVMPNSDIGSAYASNEMIKIIASYADTFTLELKQKFPEKDEYTIEDFRTLSPEKVGYTTPDKVNSFTYYAMYFSYMAKSKGYTWKKVVEKMSEPMLETAKKYNQLMQDGISSRISEDNVDNILDVPYGNNILNSLTAAHGTQVAGVIAADRNNDIGIKGVADVKLMLLRVTTVGGDEYDKDVALAIRYAVDNGAKIINMSFGKPISTHKEWVDDALKYAAENNVLVVHASGNSYENTNDKWKYPVKHMNDGSDLNNFINVGSIGPDGNPAISSNFGSTEVDLFAPGVNIYTLSDDGGYIKVGGTSMASPMVAGVAAMILTYYPKISAEDLKDLILNSVFFRGDDIVLKPQMPILAQPRESVSFGDLCVTGGILDAAKAIEMAKDVSKNSKKRKK